MRRKKITIIITCIVTYILYAVLTGGIVIYNNNDFGGQRDVSFATDLKSDLWVDSNFSGGGIPFIGFYHFNRLPCALRVQIWDKEKRFSRITIETITVKYTENQNETFKVNWYQNLMPHTQVNSSSEGIVRIPMLMLSKNTPNVINQYKNCDVTLTGFMTTINNEKIPFSVLERFKHKKEFGISTFWEMIAGA